MCHASITDDDVELVCDRITAEGTPHRGRRFPRKARQALRDAAVATLDLCSRLRPSFLRVDPHPTVDVNQLTILENDLGVVLDEETALATLRRRLHAPHSPADDDLLYV